jgi:hypothetical protein
MTSDQTNQTCEEKLAQLLELLPEAARGGMRDRIEAALAGQRRGDAEDEARAMRFLQDLDIFVHISGPQFMYSRGIAETLRVGEEIFELAYAMKRAMQ